jgi:hypothetical protein
MFALGAKTTNLKILSELVYYTEGSSVASIYTVFPSK